MFKETNILILMATYQGESFLKAQIESILNQTYKNWTLLIRDDGSTDHSKEILLSYKNLDPRILIVDDHTKKLGPCANFAKLMQIAKNMDQPYIMLADQDDVWDRDKIAITLENMQILQQQHGNVPLLVHTDLQVVDQDLNEISASYWNYEGLDPVIAKNLATLMIQNVVTGCTVMMNRPLLTLAADIPADVIMHDWWLALVARAFGEILSINRPTMAYRQHSKNCIGAKKRKFRLLGFARSRAFIRNSQTQAESLLKTFDKTLAEPQKSIISCYAHLDKHGFISRRLLAGKYGFRKMGFLKNLRFLLLL
ncbi:MAG: putative glycosyltransferase [Gammaproteobacteria bacterium]|jgi:glycosyltransferase involved in cell wall biosynthesis|nr:putative glycosyltransferase [Gammaproteobacteria bacterium]